MRQVMKPMAQTETRAQNRHDGSPSGQRERRRSSSRFRISLAISALLHVLLVFLYPLFVNRFVPDAAPPFFVVERTQPEGTRLVLIREVVEEALEPEAEPEEEEEEPVPVEEPVTPGPEVEAEPPAAEPDPWELWTPAERLRPNEETAKLWAPVDRELTDLTPEERIQAEVEVLVHMWNDSVAAAVAAASDATDWTHTDESGNKWGVSPGKLHLGKITLPLPFYFGPANGVQRDELARRAAELRDIEQGAALGAVRETVRDRAKAMRERRDAERAAERGEVADTTRSRR